MVLCILYSSTLCTRLEFYLVDDLYSSSCCCMSSLCMETTRDEFIHDPKLSRTAESMEALLRRYL